MFHQAQATDYLDFLQDLEILASNSHVDTIAVNAGGAGYAVGDLFDINGGTVVGGLNATGEVLTEAAGVVTSVRLYNGGAYTANPGVGATTTAITGGGAGLTVDTTILATGWSVNRSGLVSGGPERELLMQGTGSGTDDIYIAIETYRNIGAGSFGWLLTGASGFDNGFDVNNQPGSSRQAAAGAGADCYVPMNNGIIDYTVVIDTFHIKGIARSGSSYGNFYLGFINTYNTKGEYPYPLTILGNSSQTSDPFNLTSDFLSGMCDPRTPGSNGDGPGTIRLVDGNWYRIRNGYPGAGNSVTFDQTRCIFPNQSIYNPTQAQQIDEFDSTNVGILGMPKNWFGGINDTPSVNLFASLDSGGDFGFLWPTVIYQVTPSIQILGELIDVYPTTTFGTAIVSEDTYTDVNGDTYLIFQNCNRTDSWAFFGIKRNF